MGEDSTAGIGTVTFYNPENGLFGGLGHGICDVDTNSLMPMKNGDIVPVTISGVTKGQKGAAGELRGYFSSNQAIGNLFINSDEGVYGQLDASPVEQQALPVAMKQEVKEGPAQILTTVADGEPQYYNVTIESIEYKKFFLSKKFSCFGDGRSFVGKNRWHCTRHEWKSYYSKW